MSNNARLLLPAVAVTGTSILVGCSSYNTVGCNASYGSYGTYGSFGGSIAQAKGHKARARRIQSASAGQPNGNGYGSCYAANPAAGIYEGTLTDQATQQQTPVVAIVAEDGEGRISAQNGTYYSLNVFNSGYSFSGSFNAYSQGPQFANGQLTSSGSFSGSPASTGPNLTLQYQPSDMASVALSFDQTYDSASSLIELQGSWSYAAGGLSLNLSVQPSGSWTGSDSNGCTYSGSFGLIDSNFDAYSVQYTRSCNGTSETFSGLASYFSASGSSPSQLKLFANDQTGDFLAANLQSG